MEFHGMVVTRFVHVLAKSLNYIIIVKFPRCMTDQVHTPVYQEFLAMMTNLVLLMKRVQYLLTNQLAYAD